MPPKVRETRRRATRRNAVLFDGTEGIDEDELFDIAPVRNSATAAARQRGSTTEGDMHNDTSRANKRRRRHTAPAGSDTVSTAQDEQVPSARTKMDTTYPAQNVYVRRAPRTVSRTHAQSDTDSDPLQPLNPRQATRDESSPPTRRNEEVGTTRPAPVNSNTNTAPAGAEKEDNDASQQTKQAEAPRSAAPQETERTQEPLGEASPARAVVQREDEFEAEASGSESDSQHDASSEEDQPAPPTLAAQLDDDQFTTPARDNGAANDEPAPVPSNPERIHTNRSAPCNGQVDVSKLQTRMTRIVSYPKMGAYLAICGRAPFSKEQYEYLRQFVAGAASPEQARVLMQPYKTVRRQMRANLGKWCFPTSTIKFVENVERQRSGRALREVCTDDGKKRPAQACVRLVLPSEWAKLDVCTYTFYSDVFEHPSKDTLEHLSIENAPIVQRRAPFIGKELVLWSLFEGAPSVTKQGDTVDIQCAARPNPVEDRRAVSEEWFSERPIPHGTNVRAVLCGTWIIGAVPPLGARSAGPTPLPAGGSKWTVHERALQSKFSRPSPNQPALDAVLEQVDSEGRAPPNAGGTQTLLAYSTNVIQLHPGDQCVLFRTERSHADIYEHGSSFREGALTQHGLLIGSPVRQALGLPSERLVWIDIEERGGGRATVRYVGTSNVTDMPVWVSGCGSTRTTSTNLVSQETWASLLTGHGTSCTDSPCTWTGSSKQRRSVTKGPWEDATCCRSVFPSRPEGGMLRFAS